MIVMGKSASYFAAIVALLSLQCCSAEVTDEPSSTDCLQSHKTLVTSMSDFWEAFEFAFLHEYCPESFLNQTKEDASSSGNDICKFEREESPDMILSVVEIDYDPVWQGDFSHMSVEEFNGGCNSNGGRVCALSVNQEVSGIVNGTQRDSKAFVKDYPICTSASCSEDETIPLLRQDFVRGITGEGRRLSSTSPFPPLLHRSLEKMGNLCALSETNEQLLEDRGVYSLRCFLDVVNLDCSREVVMDLKMDQVGEKTEEYTESPEEIMEETTMKPDKDMNEEDVASQQQKAIENKVHVEKDRAKNVVDQLKGMEETVVRDTVDMLENMIREKGEAFDSNECTEAHKMIHDDHFTASEDQFMESFVTQNCMFEFNNDGQHFEYGHGNKKVCFVETEVEERYLYDDVQADYGDVWKTGDSNFSQYLNVCDEKGGNLCAIQIEHAFSVTTNETEFESGLFLRKYPVCISSLCSEKDIAAIIRHKMLHGITLDEGRQRRWLSSSHQHAPAHVHRAMKAAKEMCFLDKEQKKALEEDSGMKDLRCSLRVGKLECGIEKF